MAEPQLEDGGEPADNDDEGTKDHDVISDFDGSDDATDDVEAVGTADLGIEEDNDLVTGFDGFDDADDNSDDTDDSSASTTPETGPTISAAIEEGMAEVAVIGLEGRERDRVRSEMQAIASKFKLGYFGEQCVEKYLQKDIEDIPPEYGLAASLIAFLAVAMYKRPDGADKAKDALTSIHSKFSGDDQPPEQPPEPTEDDEEADSDE